MKRTLTIDDACAPSISKEAVPVPGTSVPEQELCEKAGPEGSEGVLEAPLAVV